MSKFFIDNFEGSSDDPAESTGFDDECDERTRVERKIERTRERLKRVVLARESDVEAYIRMSGGLESTSIAGAGVQENPQLFRIRQHFEKKNKKHSQETELLQKKLEQLQQRLIELDSGVESQQQKTVLSNVGQGIKKTGANLRGTITDYTGSVISAPRDFASMLKNKFGSADNIPSAVSSSNNSKQGMRPVATAIADVKRNMQRAKFYTDMTPTTTIVTNNDRSRAYSAGQHHHNDAIGQSVTTRINEQSIPDESSVDWMTMHGDIREELRDLRIKYNSIVDSLDILRNQHQYEYNYYNNALHEERFRCQRLEEQLNDTIELNQAEVMNLKNEVQSIANRIEYQYMDRFRDLQDLIETGNNRVTQLEAKIEVDLRLQDGPTLLRSVLLSAANIVVETLKIILFLSSVILDAFKPFTGSRSRSALFLGITIFISIVLFGYLDVDTTIGRLIWSRFQRSVD